MFLTRYLSGGKISIGIVVDKGLLNSVNILWAEREAWVGRWRRAVTSREMEPFALLFGDKLQQLLPLPEAESSAVSQSAQEDWNWHI